MAEAWTADEHPLDVQAILRALDAHGVRHVVVGGVAAIFHGYSGATFDADIVPDLAPENLGRLAQALRALDARVFAAPGRLDLRGDGSPPEADDLDLAEPESLRRHLVWYFSTAAGRLDVLLVIDGPGGFQTIAPRAVRSIVSGLAVLVIALEDLIEAKETAGREKDRRSLDELRRLLAEQS